MKRNVRGATRGRRWRRDEFEETCARRTVGVGVRLESLGEAADVLVEHVEVVAVVHHEVERDLLAEAQ